MSESIVEQAALDWLKGLDYEILSELVIAPAEPAAERSDYKQLFLFDRLQTTLEDLNPRIPLEGLQEALQKVLLPKMLSGELRLPPQVLRQAGVPTAKLAEATP